MSYFTSRANSSCIDKWHLLKHAMAERRKLVRGDGLNRLLLPWCQQLLFQEGKQTTLNGSLIPHDMNQNQTKCSEKTHSINQSRTNTESIIEAWASPAEHLSLLYISCPSRWIESCFSWSPRCCAPLSLLPSPCWPLLHPSSMLESSRWVKFSTERPTEEKLEWLQVSWKLCLRSPGKAVLSGACLLPCPGASLKVSRRPFLHKQTIVYPWGLQCQEPWG